ncbi:hypothetical protein BDZ91DRAFT_838123 [Kalaharituber pfeilii]|nr:hypothetical protein BDZ91DRAFT_838123 [Kalaharituber pfeilii]
MQVRENINHAPRLLGIVITLCAVSCFVVMLRLWVRLRMTRQGLGLDDAGMITSIVLNIAETSLVCVTTNYGLGRHIEYVDPTNFTIFLKVSKTTFFTYTSCPYSVNAYDTVQLAYSAGLVYVSLIFVIKSSLILFYLRLSLSRYFNAWCWGYFGLNSVFWIVFTVVGIFSCAPIPYFWDRSIPGGKCLNLEKLYLAHASISVIMDVAALALPIRAVFSLNLVLREKIQLAALFGCGLFVTIASFVRMTTLFNFGTETDPTWATVKSHTWSICTNIRSSQNWQSDQPRGSINQGQQARKKGGKTGSSGRKGEDITMTTQYFIEQEMAQYGGPVIRIPDEVVSGTSRASSSPTDLELELARAGLA